MQKKDNNPETSEKKSYRVTIREVHTVDYLIEASSPDEAVDLVRQGKGILGEGSYEYSHQLDSNKWTAEEVRE